MPYANLCQQRRSGHHTIKSKHKIIASLKFSSYQTYILNISHQNKLFKHSQERSEFILLKIPPYHHQKHQKLHVKIVTHMHYGNEFELLIAVVFFVIPQIEGLVPKSQYFVISFCLGEGELIPYFYLISLEIRSELVLMRDKIGQINNLTGIYIMEMSKMKHPQHYMTLFEIYFRRFEHQPQSDPFSIIFTPLMEVVFETI